MHFHYNLSPNHYPALKLQRIYYNRKSEKIKLPDLEGNMELLNCTVGLSTLQSRPFFTT